ncbi:alanine--tRNA ligase [Pontibacter sp. G13]|uniref:alanine--tRNA ligase n=1 Tax=Pontibacter sp. G13 TaxID=3074898 RepID=UPI00288A0698|nr:alanine--tRNA ligase [Pontibacter sp. G13]WNJ21043.1 alanine--tRNA ligase [Pontibacter sp. G13]
MKTSTEIRNTFFEFFEQKAHQIVDSAPIVIKDDPTLMFINAGMNPFKDIFLGLKNPEYKRVADTQKCLRVSGKHNDLEEVGHDTYHHTMFEMLGNWSFGDYYKQEAIAWAWEYLTEVLEIPKDRLYATVFEGDAQDGLGPDTEAEDFWKARMDENHIIRASKKDNFWEMGDTGPCGPCSEIHMDLRSDADRQAVSGRSLVNADHPEVVEIWNLVFMQFDRKADGSLVELPAKHVDTGMGFERLVMSIQGKQSTYDTDLFDATRGFVEQKAGIKYDSATEEQRIAIRVIIDHIRAIVFTIGDGQIPSNTGAGYVIRRILRRAARYAYAYLNIEEPFMYEMVALLAKQYESVFPEVKQQQDFITRIIQEEEKGFLRKLESGTQMFGQYVSEHPGSKTVDGEFAFKLYDTFGFPIDLTQLIAKEQGMEVDMDGFSKQLEAQKTRSRKATEMDAGDWTIVNPAEDLPEFRGYDTLELTTKIRQFRTVKTKKKDLFQLVLDETPFYAESGGQIGDRGTISQGDQVLRVLDTKKENQLIIHFVDKLPADASGEWVAQVNDSFRSDVKSNHSATHLLHAALRQVLGDHVEQRGSLVSEKALRFDFSHFAKVTDEELQQIEDIVNTKIAAGISLGEHRSVPIEDAKNMGAMMLFGEKYGDEVRVIEFDPAFSVELCGGTHVANTHEIRLFKLISESSVAAGIRRVEAYTGNRAFSFLSDRSGTLEEIGALLKAPKQPVKAIEDLLAKVKEQEKQLQQLNAEKVGQLRKALLEAVEDKGGLKLIRKQVDVSSSDDLKQLSFDLKKDSENTLIVLGAVVKNKPLLSVIISDDLVAAKRFNAGDMIRTLAKEIKGGGGGQPFYATAGGKDIDGLPSALAKVDELI